MLQRDVQKDVTGFVTVMIIEEETDEIIVVHETTIVRIAMGA